MLPILFLLIQIFFLILIFYLGIAFLTGAPFVPTTNPAASAMMRLVPIRKGRMTVCDLGSGDGKLLFLAAGKGARAIGYEINPFLVILTYFRKIFHPDGSLVSCRWKNFWKADIRNADVVFVYLLPWRMAQLEKKIMKETKAGTVVVSNSFIFPHLKKIDADETHHVYVFRVGK